MGSAASTKTSIDAKLLEEILEIMPQNRGKAPTEILNAVKKDLIFARETRITMPKGIQFDESKSVAIDQYQTNNTIASNKVAKHHALKAKGSVKGLLSKVGHLCRVVKDSEVSKKFYEEVIGAELLNRPHFPTNGYWFWLGNVQLHIIESDLAIPPDHPDGGTRVNHLSFDCYDFDAVCVRLETAGIPFKRVKVPVGDKVGINQIFFQDPDKHWIEMCDCQRFDDFIFGEYDVKRAEELRKAYLEGVEPRGNFLASLVFMLLSNNGSVSTESPLRDLFDQYSGGDGELSLEDLTKVMSRLNGRPLDAADEIQMKNLLSKIDTSGDGGVTFDEFHSYLTQQLMNAPDQEDLLKEVFNVVDKNASGTISTLEFRDTFKSLQPDMPVDEIDKIFAQVDVSCDGMICKEEFRALFELFKSKILK